MNSVKTADCSTASDCSQHVVILSLPIQLVSRNTVYSNIPTIMSVTTVRKGETDETGKVQNRDD